MSTNHDSLLNAVAKRDLLFCTKKASASEWKAQADKFMAADWAYDAVDFLTQSNDPNAIRQAAAKFEQEGNVFLLLKAYRALSIVDLSATEQTQLRNCAAKAEAGGKIRYAIKAFERLGETAEMERLKAMIATDGDMQVEEAAVFIPPTEEVVDEVTQEDA